MSRVTKVDKLLTQQNSCHKHTKLTYYKPQTCLYCKIYGFHTRHNMPIVLL